MIISRVRSVTTHALQTTERQTDRRHIVPKARPNGRPKTSENGTYLTYMFTHSWWITWSDGSSIHCTLLLDLQSFTTLGNQADGRIHVMSMHMPAEIRHGWHYIDKCKSDQKGYRYDGSML